MVIGSTTLIIFFMAEQLYWDTFHITTERRCHQWPVRPSIICCICLYFCFKLFGSSLVKFNLSILSTLTSLLSSPLSDILPTKYYRKVLKYWDT